MTHVLLTTIQMMALTFAIGFVVAAIIKAIAYGADSLEYLSTHHEELRLKKIKQRKQLEALYELMGKTMSPEELSFLFENSHGVSRGSAEQKLTDDFLHSFSKGSDEYSILDYYYPRKDSKKDH